MSHTPGPWETSSINGRVVMAGATKVATANNTSPPPVAWHNARLIAAAPDMFYIIAGIAAVVAEDSHWGKRIAEVIKKIEGEA